MLQDASDPDSGTAPDRDFDAEPRSDEPTESWWSRVAGGREVLAVALPLVISSLSWTVMTFVDRMFLAWDSGTAMAAAFAASTLWFAVCCLPLGICMYVATFVSQYFGNDQPERIGVSVWQGVWVSLGFTPLFGVAIWAAPDLIGLADHATELHTLEVLYFRILCYGAPAMLLAQALSSFYAGRGETGVVMKVDCGTVVLNLALDYCWIFGEFGFPALGIAGAGWATVTSLWVKAAIYLGLILRKHHRERFGTLTGLRIDRALLGRLLYFGTPSGLQFLLDVSGFTIFVMLISRLGAVQAEATSMAFSISTLAFMPIWGFGQAVSILVGQRLGENQPDLAARSTWTSLRIALGYMGLVSLSYLVIPELFLAGFFMDGPGQAEVSEAHRSEVRSLAVVLLRFVAAYNLFDALLMIFVSAIKGAGDTRFVLWVSAIMAVFLSVGSWIGVEVLGFGLYGCWGLITAWIWIMGVVFCVRFLGGRWRSMRVIEERVIV